MRIVIAGMGVAGGVIAAGLADLPGLELECVEQVDRDDHASAGNGLNIGPNALTALKATLPGMAAALQAVALPWKGWRASTIEGELLHLLPLAEVAQDHGLRIRWSDLYRVCREAAGRNIDYRHAAVAVEPCGGRPALQVEAQDQRRMLGAADLLVVAEGRYSSLRAQLCGPPAIRHLGVANFRVLLDDGGVLPIDDLEQWTSGPNRLLAFRVRDGLIYLSGNLPLVPGLRERGAEIVGHGRSNAERQAEMDEATERGMIGQVTARIEPEEGKPPAGWMGPWVNETHVTPDLLREAGYTYVMDWAMDEQPVWLKTRAGPLLAVPYARPTNDITALHGAKVAPALWGDMLIDQFDEMLRQSEQEPLVFNLSLPPFLVGHAFRLKHLRRAVMHIAARRERVWMARAGDIAAHVMALPGETVV